MFLCMKSGGEELRSVRMGKAPLSSNANNSIPQSLERLEAHSQREMG